MDPEGVVVYTVHHSGDSWGFSEELGSTPLSGDPYRVEDSSVVDESIRYGDVISVTPVGGLQLRLEKVVQNSSRKTASWVIPKEDAAAPDLPILLQEIPDAGGVWERLFAGLLVVRLRQDAIPNVKQEYQRWLERNK